MQKDGDTKMAQVNPKMPPASDTNFSSVAWQRFFHDLFTRVTAAGMVAWSQISTVGSNLTDIVTRRHNDLQNIQGGTAAQYYHLTSAQSSLIPSGVPTVGQVPIAISGTASAWGTVRSLVTTQRIYTAGSGTYTTPAGCVALKIKLAGGGGGGGGSSSTLSDGGTGGTGGTTTFGTSLLTATGGLGGVNLSAYGGVGGVATINAPASGLGFSGMKGNDNAVNHTYYSPVARGGITFFGGGAVSNTGSGGSGAYVDALITSPSATYAHAVGAGGTAGVAGTGGTAGLAGAYGVIIIEEWYV